MHLAYRLYTLLCTTHPAVCILLLSLGFQPTVLTLVNRLPVLCQLHAENYTAPLPAIFADPVPLAFSSFYFLACVFSSAFAMVYLYAMDDTVADEPGSFSKSSDLLFWCFLYANTCMSISLTTRHLTSQDQLALRCILHFGGLFLLCTSSEASPMRGSHQLSLTLALLLLMGSSLFATTLACSQVCHHIYSDYACLCLPMTATPAIHRWPWPCVICTAS